MSDQPVGSAATFFDTTGRAASGGGLRHSFKDPADILRALRIPRDVRTESPIADEVRAALGVPVGAGTAEYPRTRIATACFEIHLGTAIPLSEIEATQLPALPPQTVVPFTATVDITFIPYIVLSGYFIFNSPEVTGWRITQGQFGFGNVSPLLDRLYIVGELLPIGAEGEPAASPTPYVVIVGSYMSPMSYPGYFLNSAGGLWNCNTVFKGWQACS
jgi:hypothetical protein